MDVDEKYQNKLLDMLIDSYFQGLQDGAFAIKDIIDNTDRDKVKEEIISSLNLSCQ